MRTTTSNKNIMFPDNIHRYIDWDQVSRFYLKTETESSLRYVVFWNIKQDGVLNKNRTMDNVQKRNIFIIVTNLRSY
jgi:hypothetical protein